MPNYDDLIGKYILAAVLEDQGQALPELEIPLLYPQAADLCFQPGPGPRNPSPVFCWLNYITRELCLLELYSGTPTGKGILRGPLRKHLEFFQNLCLQAEGKKDPEPPLQAMWVLTSGRPDGVLAAYGCRPVPDAPAGFYRALDVLNLWFVVLPELPRERDTLILRLLGSSALRLEALAEIKAIPGDDPDSKALIPILVYVQAIIEKDPRIPGPEKEEFMNAMRQEFERFRQSIADAARGDGEKKGEKKGVAESILIVLEARGLSVTEEARRAILACEDPALLQTWLKQALSARNTDEILHAG